MHRKVWMLHLNVSHTLFPFTPVASNFILFFPLFSGCVSLCCPPPSSSDNRGKSQRPLAVWMSAALQQPFCHNAGTTASMQSQLMAVYPFASHCFFHTRNFYRVWPQKPAPAKLQDAVFVPINEIKMSFCSVDSQTNIERFDSCV